MDILELLFALALWLVFAFLGWRKKAARQAAPADEPGWPEWEPQEDLAGEQPGAEGEQGTADPAAAPPPRRPAAPLDLRDLIRQLKEGLAPPVEREQPVREAPREMPRPALDEPPPPPPVSEPDIFLPLRTLPPSRRRRSTFASAVLADLQSGPSSLARAVVLREILGPPVGLRDPHGPDRRGV